MAFVVPKFQISPVPHSPPPRVASWRMVFRNKESCSEVQFTCPAAESKAEGPTLYQKPLARWKVHTGCLTSALDPVTLHHQCCGSATQGQQGPGHQMLHISHHLERGRGGGASGSESTPQHRAPQMPQMVRARQSIGINVGVIDTDMGATIVICSSRTPCALVCSVVWCSVLVLVLVLVSCCVVLCCGPVWSLVVPWALWVLWALAGEHLAVFRTSMCRLKNFENSTFFETLLSALDDYRVTIWVLEHPWGPHRGR